MPRYPSRRHFLAMSAAAGVGSGASSQIWSASPGLHVPPEDAPHDLTFMQWPASYDIYQDSRLLSQAQQTIADIANTLSACQPVIILAEATHHAFMLSYLSKAVEIWDIPTQDLWARDSGPLFAINEAGQRVISHIRFNGWGGKQNSLDDAKSRPALPNDWGLR